MTDPAFSLVDTHCHLDLDAFADDRELVIQRAFSAGVTQIVVPAVDFDSVGRVLALTDHYSQLFAAVGIHPNEIPVDKSLSSSRDYLFDIAHHPKVVAIGEIGLDYHWDKSLPEVQNKWLRMQLDLASELRLPVIIHNRDATDDTVKLLSDWVLHGLPDSLAERPGVLHSFSSDWNAAQDCLKLGFYLGFTGPLTYKNAEVTREVAAKAVAERIVIETDAPFLAPQPKRGQRNEPAFVRDIAQKLAEVRNVDLAFIADLTTTNAHRLFRMPPSEE